VKAAVNAPHSTRFAKSGPLPFRAKRLDVESEENKLPSKEETVDVVMAK
jgi:hypothetical protein